MVGIVDGRQRGHRQRAITHDSKQQNGERDQRGHDRALDENARNVHGLLRSRCELVRGDRLNVSARVQQKLPVRDHGLARLKSFLDNHVASGARSHRDHAGLGGLVRLHHVDELSCLSRLDRLGRYHRRVRPGVERERYVDELPRPELPLFIRKRCLQADRSRVRIDRVVDYAQDAAHGFSGAVLERSGDQELTRGAGLPDRCEMLLRNSEGDENGSDLVDDDQRFSVGLDEVAGLHQQVSSASRYGRMDFAVTQIELCPLDGGAVAFLRCADASDGRLIGADAFAQGVGVGANLVELLARDDALFGERFVASRLRHRRFSIGPGRGRGWLPPAATVRHPWPRRLPPAAKPRDKDAGRFQRADRLD